MPILFKEILQDSTVAWQKRHFCYDRFFFEPN